MLTLFGAPGGVIRGPDPVKLNARYGILVVNKMCTTVFKEINFWQIKIEALAWSYNRSLGIFNVIADTEHAQN